MGFSNFEWNINEAELDKMVDLYRAKNIPIDGYAFDYDWKRYGDDNYGEFTWNTDNFPSAATTALKNKMDAKGIKMIGITKPRIVTRLQNGTTTIQGMMQQSITTSIPVTTSIPTTSCPSLFGVLTPTRPRSGPGGGNTLRMPLIKVLSVGGTMKLTKFRLMGLTIGLGTLRL